MEKMLQWDPAKRPSAAEALAHPWFDDVREAEFERPSSTGIEWGRLETMKMTKSNLQVGTSTTGEGGRTRVVSISPRP